ncbi:SMI1/KNR4 family protein [Dactylosporangium sp. NPDC051484]|uniref:SMI1/KNR4 family protein n=1 Tax=Dactylosporangium sp. NPDC051484 TaxID=3154942 RepID=UPI00344C3021
MLSQPQYHARSLALAGRTAETSPDAVAAVDRFATARGFPLPASVREWYSLAAGQETLSRFSNEDRVYAAHELGRPEPYWPDGEPDQERDWDPVAERQLLPFMIENQGVCYWAVMLDGSDDPPVMISFDDLEPTDEWTMLTASFSDLVYTRIWDHRAMSSVQALRAPVASFDPAAWAGLGTRLEERPADSNGQRYRFAGSADDQRVLLEKDAWGPTGQCYLWAASDDLLVDLVTTVRASSGLAKQLSTYWGSETLDRIGHRLEA